MNLSLSDRAVLHSPRNQEEPPRLEGDIAVPELDGQAPVDGTDIAVSTMVAIAPLCD